MNLKQLLILFTFLTAILLAPNKLVGQDYMELLVEIVDEDYEKCLKKSLKYISKPETKKDALPYLYASMAYYNMSRDNQYREDYPKAFKKSLSYVGKYRKKDKSYEYKSDAIEFIEKLKFILAEDIANNKLLYIDKEDKYIKKNASLLKKIEKMDPNDHAVTLLRGVYETKKKNRTEGKELLKEGLEHLKSLEDVSLFEQLTESQQHFLKTGIIEYALYINNKDPEESKRVLEIGKPLFIEKNTSILIENTEDYKKVYKEIYS